MMCEHTFLVAQTKALCDCLVIELHDTFVQTVDTVQTNVSFLFLRIKDMLLSTTPHRA